MLTPPGEESAVGNFTAHTILSMLLYDEPDHVIRQGKDIPLFTYRSEMHALKNVCLLNRVNEIILLVQEDKRMERGDPEPHLLSILKSFLASS
jgi:hypothetical protein